MSALHGRLAKFNLEVEPTKTQMLKFGIGGGVPQRRNGPRTFDFLGFTHLIRKSRFGRTVLALQTARARAAKKLKEVYVRFRNMRTEGTKEMRKYAIQHVRGHIQYYGVSGNTEALFSYIWRVVRALFKWLNRRSQRKSMTWAKYELWLKAINFPQARVVHRMYA